MRSAEEGLNSALQDVCHVETIEARTSICTLRLRRTPRGARPYCGPFTRRTGLEDRASGQRDEYLGAGTGPLFWITSRRANSWSRKSRYRAGGVKIRRNDFGSVMMEEKWSAVPAPLQPRRAQIETLIREAGYERDAE